MLVYILSIVLLALCTITYYPAVLNSGGSFVSLGVSATAVMLLVISFFKNYPVHQFIKKYLSISFFIVLFSFLFMFIKGELYFGEIMEILIPLFMLFIGFQSTLSHKQYLIILSCYVFCVIIVSYVTIMTNIGGFRIESQYLVTVKNSLGGMLALAGVISVFGIKILKENKLKIISTFAFLLIMLFILTIRARLAVLSMLFVSSLIYKQGIKTQTIISCLLPCCIFAILKYFTTGNFITENIDQFVFDSLFLNKTEDLTSGRTDLIFVALSVIEQSPLWGNLTLQTDLAWIHNYSMLKLSSFGLLGASPWIILYFYIIVFIVKKYRHIKFLKFSNLGVFLLMVVFIISLGEPTYPYGPGTVSIIAYYFFGVFLNNEMINKHINKIL